MVDPADGLSKSAVNNLVVYSRDAGCGGAWSLLSLMSALAPVPGGLTPAGAVGT